MAKPTKAQVTEPKTLRIYVFREDSDVLQTQRHYVFVGDLYVKQQDNQTPPALAQTLRETAKIVYPELRGMVVYRIAENPTPFSVPHKATWTEMRNIILRQESWSGSEIQGDGSVHEDIINECIHVMGRADFSDVVNPLLVFFRS